MHVPSADVEVLSGEEQAAEEQRGVRDVLEGLGAAVELCLQVLLGNRVAAHRAQAEHVLPHEMQEAARRVKKRTLSGNDGIGAVGWHGQTS